MEFRKHTLANGLQIVAECNDEAHSSAVAFYVTTGARDETDEVSGVSHFLEHMMFKGTPRRSPDDVNREFDEMGAIYNAYTSEENTVYHAAVLPEYVDPVVELWSDIMRPALREEDFDAEKKVIIEEIRMYLDQPPYGADERCKSLHFGRHPLGRSVLGTVESIGALRVDAMRDYFQRRYSPGNITVVGAGRIDFDGFVASVQRHCGHWSPVATGREVAPAASRNGFECLQKATSTQEYAMQLTNGPSATDSDRYAAKVLATVLGDDSGSRLYWGLIDSGLAESASLGHQDFLGTGLYITYMSCDPEQVGGNLQVIYDLYRQAEAEGISQAELDQAKSKINSRVVLSSEKPRGRLSTVGSNWTARKEYRSVKDDLDAIDRLSLDDIHAVLARYPLSAGTTVVIGPLGDLKAPE